MSYIKWIQPSKTKVKSGEAFDLTISYKASDSGESIALSCIARRGQATITPSSVSLRKGKHREDFSITVTGSGAAEITASIPVGNGTHSSATSGVSLT